MGELPFVPVYDQDGGFVPCGQPINQRDLWLESAEQAGIDLTAGHGRQLQKGLVMVGQAAQATRQDLAHAAGEDGSGQSDLANAGQLPGLFGQGPHHFQGKKGVALAFFL